MLRRLEEFLGAHGAHYELIAHKEAVTAQEAMMTTKNILLAVDRSPRADAVRPAPVMLVRPTAVAAV